MAGFLKWIFALGLVAFGVMLTGGVLVSCLQANMATTMFGGSIGVGGKVSFWVAGIIGLLAFLGGIYMLKKH